MKIALATLVFNLVTTLCFALPPAAIVSIERIEGVVTEIAKVGPLDSVTVRLRLTDTSDPEKTKSLYSLIRRETKIEIRSLKRPRKDEVVLVLPNGTKLPFGTKLGVKLRCLNYGLRGSDASDSRWSVTPEFKEIVVVP